MTRAPLQVRDNKLVSVTTDGAELVYPISKSGIPLFAREIMTTDAKIQEAHYDHVAAGYLANLQYPHTQEYNAYLDRALRSVIDRRRLGSVADICCGRGEVMQLLGGDIQRGVGVDVSVAMLEAARAESGNPGFCFVQGDATKLPLATASFDSAFTLGGIHHINDRVGLFREIARILKPGGRFYFREPVNDFALWRWLRAVIYRVSPALDAKTEHPLRHDETAAELKEAGLRLAHWSTHGFLGFCIFMNSDVLVFNRLFRFLPGIRRLTRWSVDFDDWVVRCPGFADAGLQVIGFAEK